MLEVLAVWSFIPPCTALMLRSSDSDNSFVLGNVVTIPIAPLYTSNQSALILAAPWACCVDRLYTTLLGYIVERIRYYELCMKNYDAVASVNSFEHLAPGVSCAAIFDTTLQVVCACDALFPCYCTPCHIASESGSAGKDCAEGDSWASLGVRVGAGGSGDQ